MYNFKKVFFVGLLLFSALFLSSCFSENNIKVEFDSNGGSTVEAVSFDGKSSLKLAQVKKKASNFRVGF